VDRRVVGIGLSRGVLEEEPAHARAGVLDRAVAADRGEQHLREDLSVDAVLDPYPFGARLLGDHVLPARPRPAQAVQL
jgi:hypothetical protein